jgi:glyoxylase-like metal-dependent hydrolase (beta-lactamase superfamily II)
MIFRQFLYDSGGCASYLFGCLGRSQLAVCDPHADLVADYLRAAKRHGAPVTAIFETHIHADHPSGARALAAETGAPIYLHESARVAFPFMPLRHGQQVELGNDFVRALHTPGHTPESVCLLVGDRTRAEEPWFVLTGDTLFVGDVGRADLLGEDEATLRARQLHTSLFEVLLALPDDLEVYPGHIAGSACGKGMSGKPSSTIGFERRHNPALRPRAPEEFAAWLLADRALPPPSFVVLAVANAR